MGHKNWQLIDENKAHMPKDMWSNAFWHNILPSKPQHAIVCSSLGMKA